MTFAPDLQVVRSAAVYADTWLKTSSSSAALATIDANALSDCYKKLKEIESSLNVQDDPPPAEGETEVKLEGDDADEDDAGGGQPQKSGKKEGATSEESEVVGPRVLLCHARPRLQARFRHLEDHVLQASHDGASGKQIDGSKEVKRLRG